MNVAVGGEFQFVPENQRFGRVALRAVLPHAYSVINISPWIGNTMNKGSRFFLFLVLGAFPLIFPLWQEQAEAGNGSAQVGKPMRVNEDLSLSPTEVSLLQEQALAGSGPAALRLSYFYSDVQLNSEEALYWVRISAENGDPVGEYNFGFMLKDDKDAKNRKRAKFWLERCAARGDKHAIELLREIDSDQKSRTPGNPSVK